IRLAFTDPTIVGRFMFHCHILEHEDKGMMAQIEVYDPKTGPMPEGHMDHDHAAMPGPLQSAQAAPNGHAAHASHD
ncbi:MAG: multicopper oxidase domain-containing protein, partial [Caulobacteraceae bacterium]